MPAKWHKLHKVRIQDLMIKVIQSLAKSGQLSTSVLGVSWRISNKSNINWNNDPLTMQNRLAQVCRNTDNGSGRSRSRSTGFPGNACTHPRDSVRFLHPLLPVQWHSYAVRVPAPCADRYTRILDAADGERHKNSWHGM